MGRVDERAVRRLGAPGETGQYPVLFEAPLAAGLIGHFVSAVSGGGAVPQNELLVDSVGQQVFSPLVHIDEDPFIPRGIASGAFDNEGVATCARTLVADGVAQGYFLSSYSARKLGWPAPATPAAVTTCWCATAAKTLPPCCKNWAPACWSPSCWATA